jgi:hypothetical protein
VNPDEKQKLISEASQALSEILFELFLVDKGLNGTDESAEFEIIKSNKQ